MNGIYYYLIAFVIIWMLVTIFHDKLSNHGFELNFPIIMWKTQKLKGLISKISNFSPTFWKWYMNVGIVVAFGAMILVTGSIISSIPSIFETPSVSILIPGVDIPGSQIYVPFIYGLIGLATVVIIHEFSHGIQSVCEKIPIKSMGLLLFFILPGAFVEPDEKSLKNSKNASKLRIYAAGSVANITLAVVALMLISLISIGIPHYFAEDGISIDRIVSDSPSEGILKEGMILQAIDNHKINDSESYVNIVKSFKPGDNVTVQTNQGSYSVVLSKNPNNDSVGFFGIQAAKHYVLLNDSLGPIPWILFELFELFNWVFILNLGIGLFNLLPLKPLDGGHMLETLLSYKFKEQLVKKFVNALSGVMAIIIVFSIIAGFL
ncbi:Membrane-associated protease RseP, regulator of RpoE activity [Methanobrevibacter gottschalkii]|uniref:Membrane-associated protease RseP (Regulator of RpoE activity) n=3 Tax=Methanobacteriaceae TaxID=2159 RepID=A0A3N5C0K6_9EURY|nr:site-2 protease family protein [Methanobrevibacter gottschalkii]MCQ2971099.1 site-2 protease family protein [archaeon]OEC95826.1 membrane-associated Zn-dependent protease [Methanobrevibacter sp. A27]RPF52912.1 membrane-associated protease RseP (regulator of RpoE activity) [Methanobrevibacter gottschalkii DSM 11977]SEK78024.1 Membrane-associated protease RseP, regulator of RpoE activity [Methanobrevibacter gottschalkii]